MARNDSLAAVRTRAAKPPKATTTSARRTAVAGQVTNAAGGKVFSIGDEAQLHRFLTMGTENGTYYKTEATLTRENAEVVFRAAASAPRTLVKAIVTVSEAGRAPKQSPALFALAVAASHADDAGRKAALAALPKVARTATHLFIFLNYVEQFRGWGRGLKTAVGKWYDDKPADKLAYQMVKYRNREGRSHFDVLRQAHTYGDPDHNVLYNWVATRESAGNKLSPRFNGSPVVDRNGRALRAQLPELVLAFEALQQAKTAKDVISLLDVKGVSWEMIPDAFINEAGVWERLLNAGMPQGALIRQLPRLARLGVTKSKLGEIVAEQLMDVERLKSGRIHPLAVLVAQKTYAQGFSERGSSNWVPDRIITQALDQAFYNAYGAVVPANKDTLVGIDCSGSMSWNSVTGMPLSTVEACAAVAMVTGATEPGTGYVGFDNSPWQLDISPRKSLDQNVRYLNTQIKGGTDVSQPIQFALRNNLFVDSIQILTDGETHQGRMHPFEAMKKYRERVNPAATLSVVAMIPSGTSVVAPFDRLSLDVSGLDAGTPQILADFAAGRI